MAQTRAQAPGIDPILQSQLVAGASYPVGSGTITTATSTVTSADIGRAGNVTVYIYGTYAGVNVTFEISPDNTNWFPVAMTREDTATSESATGVLASNTIRAWTMGAPGLNYLRVRATAWTSGTAQVRIVAGTLPIEPMVSILPPRTPFYYGWIDAAGTASVESALTNFTAGTKGGANQAAATSITVPAGKTHRITAISWGLRQTSTVVNSGNISIRQAATVANTSPAVWRGNLGTGAATAAAGIFQAWSLSLVDGSLEIPSGQQWTVTWGTGAASCAVSIHVNGFEY